MSRWRVIFAAVIIFLAGTATGVVVARAYFPKVVRRMHPSQPIPVSSERRKEYLERLDRELSLTPDQRRQVEGILAASQDRMKRLWAPVEPQIKEEYHRTRSEISEVLTPEQREKMKQWHAQREQRWRENRTNNNRGAAWRERARDGRNGGTNRLENVTNGVGTSGTNTGPIPK